MSFSKLRIGAPALVSALTLVVGLAGWPKGRQ